MAVMQTARRLLDESPFLLKDGWEEAQKKKQVAYSVDGAMRRAVDYAHPKNRDATFWAVQYALVGAIRDNEKWSERGDSILRFNQHPDTTKDDAVALYDSAIKLQGRVNIAQSKAKGRK